MSGADLFRERETDRFILDRLPYFKHHFPYTVRVAHERLVNEGDSAVMGRIVVSEWCEEQFGLRSLCSSHSFTVYDRWTSFYAAFFFHRETDAAAFKMRWG